METATIDKAINPKPTDAKRRFGKTLCVISFCLFLSGIAVVPYFFMGQPDEDESQTRWSLRMPDTHDIFLHYDQMKSFYTGLCAGEVYPRWEVETNRGFGAPTTCFYPPAIYYITSLFYYVARNWVLSLLWTQLAIMAASAAAVYLYARRSLSRPAALVVMTCYAILPYHLIDQYQRGALAELLGFIWMPLILLFVEVVSGGSGRAELNARDGLEQGVQGANGQSAPSTEWKRPAMRGAAGAAGLALVYSAFIWSHPPTAFQFSMMLAVLIPLLAVARKRWSGIPLAGAGISLGLILSSAYLYPAYLEKGLIHNEFIADNWPYRESYVFQHTQYMDEHRPFFNLINMTWTVNFAIILICIIAILIIRYKRGRKPRWPRWQAGLWATMGLLASFMMTPFSDPIGRRIPMIDIGVFSWRMLGITTLAASLLAGCVADMGVRAIREGAKRLYTAWAVVTLVIASAVVFTVAAVLSPVWDGALFVPEIEHLNPTMMPRTAPDDPEDLPDVEPVQLDQDAGNISVRRWLPQHREIHASLTDPDTIWVRTFNYPGWRATVDGRPAVIATGEELGDIRIDVEPGDHEIVLDFVETPIRRRGRLATLASFAIVCAMLAGAAITMLRVRRRRSTATAL